jgi:serine/threonine protein kinase
MNLKCLDELPVDNEKGRYVKKGKVIGTGKHSKVYDCVIKEPLLSSIQTHHKYSIDFNVVLKVQTGAQHGPIWKNEIKTLLYLNSLCKQTNKYTFVPRILDAWIRRDRWCILMEKMEGECMYKTIKKGRKITPHQLTQLEKTVEELNSAVIHRDLRPANVIWNKDRNECYIIDFGYSKILSSAQSTRKESLVGFCSRIK